MNPSASNTTQASLNGPLDFVLHIYASDGPTYAPAALSDAASIIQAAISGDQWFSTGYPVQSSTYILSKSRSFQYKPLDVDISIKEICPRPYVYKEWGVPIGKDDDVFALNELDEFDSTDLNFLSNVQPAPKLLDGRLPFVEPLTWAHQLDLTFLHGLIPQPHIHPSSQAKSPQTIKMVPYKKTSPIPIPPLMHSLPPPSQYARSAWLIPVRGNFPWDGSTPAVILDSSVQLPIPADAQAGEPIVWTHSSLASFWSFLLGVQEARSVGSIGLSFHASQSYARVSQSTFSLNTTSLMPGAGNQGVLEFNTVSDRGSVTTTTPASHIILSNVDHIKVYHDTLNAMHVRNIFHIWSYTAQPLTSSNKPEKIRLLKGARLALVDERSRGILIS